MLQNKFLMEFLFYPDRNICLWWNQRMCLGTFLRLRRSLATPTLYAAVRIPSGAYILGKNFLIYKKSLTEYSYSVKDGKSKSFPRCHLDSRVHSHALCKILTYLRQLTYAHTSQSTRILKSFDCALSGPFGNLHLDPALSSRTLCARIITLISASSV